MGLSILLAHSLIGFLFIFAGVYNIYHWRPLMEAMVQKNIPHPWLVLSIGIAWETIAGGLIMLGIFIKLAAFSLMFFTVISIFMFHPFWRMTGEHRQINMGIFMTHLCVTNGALLLLMNNITPG